MHGARKAKEWLLLMLHEDMQDCCTRCGMYGVPNTANAVQQEHASAVD